MPAVTGTFVTGLIGKNGPTVHSRVVEGTNAALEHSVAIQILH